MARVLVTDAEERSVLAAARALTRAGHEVTAVAKTWPAATHWSTACQRRAVLPDPKADRVGFLACLAEQLARRPHDALLPGSDAAVATISEGREGLERVTNIGLPAKEIVRRSADKVALLHVSADADLAMPPSRVCRDAHEATAAALDLGYPLILKPAASIVASAGGLRQRRAVFVASDATLPDAVRALGSPFVVQRHERVRRHLSCGGVATPDGLLAPVFARFRRTWPVRSGAAAFAETVEPPPGLLHRIDSLVAALGWRGILELEVLELGDGRFAAIDLNPRVFGWLALAVAAGANLPEVWLQVLLGRRPVACRGRAGLRYRWEDADACHFLWQLSHGRGRAAAGVLRPRRGVVHAHFRLQDPAPLAARLIGAGYTALARGRRSTREAARSSGGLDRRQ